MGYLLRGKGRNMMCVGMHFVDLVGLGFNRHNILYKKLHDFKQLESCRMTRIYNQLVAPYLRDYASPVQTYGLHSRQH